MGTVILSMMIMFIVGVISLYLAGPCTPGHWKLAAMATLLVIGVGIIVAIPFA